MLNREFYGKESIDISRRWREEALSIEETPLLQRSNMSIEKTGSVPALQRSAMSESREDCTQLSVKIFILFKKSKRSTVV